MNLTQLARSIFGRNSVRAGVSSPSFGSAMRALRLPVLPAFLIALFVLLAPAGAQAQAPACPCTLFAPSDAPLGDATQDQPLEVGVKLQSDEDGFITALRFYKQPNNTGRHVGHIWSASGQLLGEAEFTERDGIRVAGGRPGLAGPGHPRHHLRRLVPLGERLLRIQPGRAQPRHPPRTASCPGVVRDRRQRGLQVRRQRLPDRQLERDELLGRRGLHAHAALGHTRAGDNGRSRPADGTSGAALSTQATVSFDEPMQASTITPATFTLRDGAGNLVNAAITYDAQARKATLSPQSALQNGNTYTVTVRGGTSGVTDSAGNPLAADRSWSFSTPAACPCTVFDPGQAPLGGSSSGDPLEVGMKFRADEDGFVTALRFYKHADNTGTHVGHLWTAGGQQLGEVAFTHETASGWQQETLPVPVAVTKDTTYVVSYHSSSGRHAFSPGAFSSGRRPSAAARTGRPGRRRQRRLSLRGGRLPDGDVRATNYWVDVSFNRGTLDSRAPGVLSVSPSRGATGVAESANVTATSTSRSTRARSTAARSRSRMARARRGRHGQLRLRGPQDHPDASGSPAARQGLHGNVLSGTAGVTDVAGNRLAADEVWSFSTSGSCPCTVFKPNQGPTGQASQEQPLEVGMKFRSSEDGYITSLRFYKQSNNTGRHVGHLWSTSGQLLAAATFTNETAEGWQTVELPNPVPIVKDTTYVTSYHSGSGYFPLDQGYFAQGVDNPPLKALANGVEGGNGVYRYGQSAYPDTTFNASNYWVDAVFAQTVPPDTRGPAVTENTPAANATDVDRAVNVTASFDEPLGGATVTGQNFSLRDEDGAAVPAAVTYNDQTRTATLDPQAQLASATSYTVTLKGGAGGVADVAGNPMAADKTWSFSTSTPSPSEGPGGPILVVSSPSDPFGRYYAEILRGEGLNAFSVEDGPVTAGMLSGKQVVILGAGSVTDAEVAALTTWVQGGGNLIAMRPDKKLAGLLGLSDAGGTLANGYMKVDQGSASGAGIDDQTLQFHGTADRYGLNGASAIATLFSDAVTQTSNPAVTLRGVGSGGGQAAAFTYDLARSVVYTRQGNPAWAGRSATARRAGSARPISSTARRKATSSPTGSTRRASTSRRRTSSSACWRT